MTSPDHPPESFRLAVDRPVRLPCRRTGKHLFTTDPPPIVMVQGAGVAIHAECLDCGRTFEAWLETTDYLKEHGAPLEEDR